MAETIRVDKKTYEMLKRLKGKKSYASVISGVLNRDIPKGSLLFPYLEELDKKFKGRRKERISEKIDEIVYGVKR
jgi:predicted CopG family antitoxin